MRGEGEAGEAPAEPVQIGCGPHTRTARREPSPSQRTAIPVARLGAEPMTARTHRSRSRSVLMIAAAAVLVPGILIWASCLRWRQMQLDRALVQAIDSPHASLATVQALLDGGANPNAREPHFPSFSASLGGLRDALDWWKRPARRDGCTALIAAACRGRPDIVRELLARGANVRVPSGAMYGGHLALNHWSQTQAPNGTEVVRLLLDHGADVNAATADGTTPLMLAVCYHRSEGVRLLLSRGARLGQHRAGFRAGATGVRSGRERPGR